MENKQCPHCGETIMAVANKCKHCQEWLKEESSPEKTNELNKEQNSNFFIITCFASIFLFVVAIMQDAFLEADYSHLSLITSISAKYTPEGIAALLVLCLLVYQLIFLKKHFQNKKIPFYSYLTIYAIILIMMIIYTVYCEVLGIYTDPDESSYIFELIGSIAFSIIGCIIGYRIQKESPKARIYGIFWIIYSILGLIITLIEPAYEVASNWVSIINHTVFMSITILYFRKPENKNLIKWLTIVTLFLVLGRLFGLILLYLIIEFIIRVIQKKKDKKKYTGNAESPNQM